MGTVGVYEYPDGREVCDSKTPEGRAEYKRRTMAMWRRQDGRCGLCNEPLAKAEATFEHTIPRGMGGASRDDRIEYLDESGKTQWMNCAAHGWCNALKGSKRT